MEDSSQKEKKKVRDSVGLESVSAGEREEEVVVGEERMREEPKGMAVDPKSENEEVREKNVVER